MHPLDNPVWASLQSDHASFAVRAGQALRYPSDVAPFVGVGRDGISCEDAGRLVDPGELVCFVGHAPVLSPAWNVLQSVTIAQMICSTRLAVADGPRVVELGETHLDDMLALTALVYPHYFRRRTPAMGRYVGLYEDGRLAAMAGERMRLDGHTEISAVCTHPAHAGRGHARRLVAVLANGILAEGRLAFLHVSHDNVRAKQLYERLGFAARADIALRVATRVAD
ncbi:MAG: GNAT family N-acetyltransferase [Lysobacteraceae bacterium]|nr:MAG: GNAT family N-acetyltransferase [Xanthomonadaceae bacterium]